MFLTADMVIEAKDAILIPIASVQRFQGKDYIFMQTATNTFEAIEIQVRQSNAAFVTVSNADANTWIGKQIVVKNAYSLLGKMMNISE
jgi:cobalt-zinc-cadmium efflux system membrane fusion protein